MHGVPAWLHSIGCRTVIHDTFIGKGDPLSSTTELAELHELIGGLRRCVTSLRSRYRDTPAMRRVVNDVQRILNDVELLTGKRPAATRYDERKWTIVLPADLTEAIRLDPNFVGAYYTRANVRLASGEDNDAVADYSEALQREPNHVGALNNRGNARARLGDVAGALGELLKIDRKGEL